MGLVWFGCWGWAAIAVVLSRGLGGICGARSGPVRRCSTPTLRWWRPTLRTTPARRLTRRDGPEYLLAGDEHSRAHPAEHDAPAKATRPDDDRTAGRRAGTAADGALHQPVDVSHDRGNDHQPAADTEIETAAHPHRPHRRGQPLHELAIHQRLHEQPVNHSAGLGRTAHPGHHRPGHGRPDISDAEHDEPRVAASPTTTMSTRPAQHRNNTHPNTAEPANKTTHTNRSPAAASNHQPQAITETKLTTPNGTPASANNSPTPSALTNTPRDTSTTTAPPAPTAKAN